MPTIRQKTVDGRTYKLKKYKTNKSGKQYEYYVTEDEAPVGDPVYTREEGEREFRETVLAVNRASKEDRRSGPSLPGMGGGGGSGPSLPGLGGSDDDDDDDGPSLPFM